MLVGLSKFREVVTCTPIECLVKFPIWSECLGSVLRTSNLFILKLLLLVLLVLGRSLGMLPHQGKGGGGEHDQEGLVPGV